MTNQTRPRPIYPVRDLRITNLRAKLGARGFGVYCLLLEEFADQGIEWLPYAPKTLAWSLRTSEKTLESVVKDFDLFEFTEDAKFFRHREEPDQPKAPPAEQTQVSPTERPQASPTEQSLESFENDSASNGSAGSLPLRAEARIKAPSAPSPATDPLMDPEIDQALSEAVKKCASDQLAEVMSLVKEAREDLRRKQADARGDP
ncbi:MAG: DUF4373 domain-containing protein [Thermoguttaceae bacterium]|nr:DUF4373 domain-containing protein [Thermoguttaceae bacterium]